MKQFCLDVWALTVPVDFVLSHGRVRRSHHVLVRIAREDDEGWGSAPLYDRAPHELRKIRRNVLGRLERELAPADFSEQRERAAAELRGMPDVGNAVDQALWELEARRSGTSVASLLGAELPTRVEITEQIFVREPAAAAAEATASAARGVRNLKLKVSGRPAADVRLVDAVRGAVGADVGIRVDANRAYRREDAERVADTFAALGVDEWEEPLAGSFSDLAALRSTTPLRVMLDESVKDRGELDAAIEAGALDSLNIKLGRVGGITAATQLREDCGAADVDIVIGCAEEVGPGMAAILHSAAAWRPRATEGLGWMRLGVDVAEPSPLLDEGGVVVDDAPGWGVVTTPAARPAATDTATGRLVHEDDWDLPFRVRSWIGRQRQRADVARARVRRFRR